MAQYTCDECGKSFSSKRALNQHKQDKGTHGPQAKRGKRPGKDQEIKRKNWLSELGANWADYYRRWPGKLHWSWLVFIGVTLVGVFLVTAIFWWPQAPKPIEAKALPEEGDPSLLKKVKSFPSEGFQHLFQGTPIQYETSPPTSGTHYPNATQAGFYKKMPPYGNLVHSLEHGAVVIYYHPQKLSTPAKQSLKTFVRAHDDQWSSVVVVPNSEPDPQFSYILTAWTKMLAMDQYEVEVVRAFLAQYLGRGPENPVR